MKTIVLTFLSLMAVGAGPATQPTTQPTTQPDFHAAIRNAAMAVDAAADLAVKNSAIVRKLSADADAAESRLQAARSGNDAQAKLDASRGFVSAKRELDLARKEAIEESMDVRAAKAHLAVVQKESEQAKAAAKKKQAEAEQAKMMAYDNGGVKILIGGELSSYVPYKDATTMWPDYVWLTNDRYLMISVCVRDASDGKIVHYLSWNDERFHASLVDDLGNNYLRAPLPPAAEVVGATSVATVYPGKQVTDLILFELPVAAAKSFTLTLPADNLGIDHEIKYQFQAADIVQGPDKPAEQK